MSDELELTPAHRALIEASAILPEVAAARGYFSVARPEQLVGKFGPSQRLAPALVIPVWDVYGERAFYQLRPDNPRVKDGHTLKYETPAKVKMALDCPPSTLEHIRNPKLTLWITEGVRKADALASIGLRAIALLGVWNWRGKGEDGGTTALADWETIALKGRKIVIAFDSDAFENPGVHRATQRLGRWLEHRGAELSFAYLPHADDGGKQGVDDFLAAGNGKKELLARVVSEWRPLPSSGKAKRKMPDVPERTLAEVVQAFGRWLNLPNTDAVVVVLGAVAANLVEGADPVWLLVLAPPSSGKSEILRAAASLPYVHSAATLTEGALLSGTSRREYADEARGGLLREIGSFGILLAKDFGSVLSMNRDTRAALLAMLREVYDGDVTRHVGTSGGQTLHWRGKVGLIAGATPAYDQHTAVISAMGDRFVLSRPEASDRDEQSATALGLDFEQVAQMRKELDAAVVGLFRKELPKSTRLNDAEKKRIGALADIVTHARSAVIRDGYKQEIEFVPEPEAPARFAKALAQLKAGIEQIGASPVQTWRIVRKTAFDSMPALRLMVIKALYAKGLYGSNASMSTTDVAKECRHPTRTVRRTLEDLTVLRLVQRTEAGAEQDGRADYWRLAPDGHERYARATTETVPEKSVGGQTDTPRSEKCVPETSVPPQTPATDARFSLNTSVHALTDFSGTHFSGEAGNGKAVAVDCSASEAHSKHHRPHPRTGRMTCFLCHPPPVEVAKR